MGMFLIIWDKMFGTFQKELPEQDYEPIRFGLTTPIIKPDPFNLVFHEWKEMLIDIRRSDIGWKERFFYLFGPPGWSHDGSRKTSAQLREQADNSEANEMELNPELANAETAAIYSRNPR